MKLFDFFKKNYKYILFFLLVFLILVLFGTNNTDNFWNYGMAHAIRIGEIPYKDFNIISTPLYPFIMSIFLIFNDSYTMFLAGQSLLCTILFFFVNKLIPNNFVKFIFFVFFPIFYFVFPNYNFLIFLLLVIVIYLEEKCANDYLIGVVLGLLILSKHTIGGVILIFSLISTFNLKRSGKRLLSALITLVPFLVYLIFTKSLMSFIDLCIFGLFDFGKSNHFFSILCFGVIMILIYAIISFFKDKSYLNYYLIASISFVIPIVDFFHFKYLFVFFIFIIFLKYKFSRKSNFIFLLLILGTFLSNIRSNSEFLLNYRFLKFSHFEYYCVSMEDKVFYENILKKYQSYDNVFMLSMYSMLIDIASDHEITYFNIPLYGNFGYNGVNKMIKKISDVHDTYFFIEDSKNRQYAHELSDYVRKIGKKVDDFETMEIYYIE